MTLIDTSASFPHRSTDPVRRVVYRFTGSHQVEHGRLALVLAPEGEVTIHVGADSLEMAPRDAVVVCPIDAREARIVANGPAVGISFDPEVFSLLLDLGLGGGGAGGALERVHQALITAGRSTVSLRPSETSFWNLAALVRSGDTNVPLESNWDALQLMACVIRRVGPLVARSLPTMVQLRPRDREGQLVATASRIIETEYASQLTVPQLAERLSVSASTLNRAFKRELGVSVKDHIAAIRLARFENLLRETGVSVTEASRLVGFRSSSQIREKFREVHGVSASIWRATENDEPPLGFAATA